MTASQDDTPLSDRRNADRRRRDEAVPFTDRRKGQRRGGDDRRSAPRIS